MHKLQPEFGLRTHRNIRLEEMINNSSIFGTARATSTEWSASTPRLKSEFCDPCTLASALLRNHYNWTEQKLKVSYTELDPSFPHQI